MQVYILLNALFVEISHSDLIYLKNKGQKNQQGNTHTHKNLLNPAVNRVPGEPLLGSRYNQCS